MKPKYPIPVGSMRNQCCACGLLFGGLTAFDRHRVGDITKGTRRCLTLSELQARGMVVSADGYLGMAFVKGSAQIPAEAL